MLYVIFVRRLKLILNQERSFKIDYGKNMSLNTPEKAKQPNEETEKNIKIVRVYLSKSGTSDILIEYFSLSSIGECGILL